jgi:hypothetical protein
MANSPRLVMPHIDASLPQKEVAHADTLGISTVCYCQELIWGGTEWIVKSKVS